MRETPDPLRQFYLTELQPCPYIEGQLEQRIVTPIQPSVRPVDFDQLSEAGFRRTQDWLYKPACPRCSACRSVRIVVDRFVSSRTFKKILKKNADLHFEELPPVASQEQYALFHRYLEGRHADGGMASMTFEDYARMVERCADTTRVIEFRLAASGQLVAVTLSDYLRDGISGVYKFFDPELAARSLGTFIILWHVRRAAELGLAHVYLGYWIEESEKMAYKARFRPLEILKGTNWHPFRPPADTRSPSS